MARPKSFISQSEKEQKPFVEIFKSFCGTSARLLIEQPDFVIGRDGTSATIKPGVWAEFNQSLYHCTDPEIAKAIHEHRDYCGNGGADKYISLNDLISSPNASMKALVCPHCRQADYTEKALFMQHVAECATKKTQRAATANLRNDLKQVDRAGSVAEDDIGAQPGR